MWKQFWRSGFWEAIWRWVSQYSHECVWAGSSRGWGSHGEGSVAPGPVLGSECWREEVGIRGTEAVGRSVVVEQGWWGSKGAWLWRTLWVRRTTYWEPVDLLKDRGDVVAGLGEEASSWVSDVLEFIEDFGWLAIENAIFLYVSINIISSHLMS